MLGIAVAVASLIALVGMSHGLETAWTNSVSERGTHVVAVKKGVVEMLTASLEQELSDRLIRTEGVRSVAGELVDLIQLESGDTVLLIGWGQGSFLWNTLRLSKGTHLGADSQNGVVLGQSVAERLKMKPGEEIRIQGRKFTAAGIFKQKGVMSNNSIIMPLQAMQALMSRPGKVTQFNLRIEEKDDPQKVQALKTRLHRRFTELSFQETSEMAENNVILKLLRAMVWGVSVIALVMALVIILNTLLMSVTERTREIGILLAVGWSGNRILGMFMLEALLLSCSGGLVGAGAGILGLNLLAGHPRLQGFIEVDIALSLLVQVLLSAVLIGVIGSLLPAWRAMKINTIEALRYE